MRTVLAAVVLLAPVAFAWWWSVRGGASSTSRCPPGDDRVVLARTETGWTAARYSANSGWLTPNGAPIRVRIVDWVDLPSVEVPK